MTTSIKSTEANGGAVSVESVADILERELKPLIKDWLLRVEKETDLMRIPMNHEERTGHLPHLLHDVINRLHLDAGTKAPISKAAADHGYLRREQGYTVAMAVEESRLLQVSIFTMLHNDVKQLEFSQLPPDVVTIADEVDAQLKEQMLLFMPRMLPKSPRPIKRFPRPLPTGDASFRIVGASLCFPLTHSSDKAAPSESDSLCAIVQSVPSTHLIIKKSKY